MNSDISTISPAGGSIGGDPTERIIRDVRGGIPDIWDAINDLRRRVGILENTVADIIIPKNWFNSNGTIVATIDGGIAIKVKNDSGQDISKGYLVRPSTTNTRGVVICSEDDYDVCGVVYNTTIVDGEWGYMVIAGFAYIYFNENGSTLRNYARMSKAADTGNTDTGKAQSDSINRVDSIRIVANVHETRLGEGLARCKLCINL